MTTIAKVAKEALLETLLKMAGMALAGNSFDDNVNQLRRRYGVQKNIPHDDALREIERRIVRRGVVKDAPQSPATIARKKRKAAKRAK